MLQYFLTCARAVEKIFLSFRSNLLSSFSSSPLQAPSPFKFPSSLPSSSKPFQFKFPFLPSSSPQPSSANKILVPRPPSIHRAARGLLGPRLDGRSRACWPECAVGAGNGRMLAAVVEQLTSLASTLPGNASFKKIGQPALEVVIERGAAGSLFCIAIDGNSAVQQNINS